MSDQAPPLPHPADAADRLTTQLVLAELRIHHWIAGPFAWLDATVLADHTPIKHTGPRQPAVDTALRQLHRTGHIQLTHLPPRTPPPNASIAHPTHGSDTLHARLALTHDETHQEHDQHTASLHTIATRLGHLLVGQDAATPKPSPTVVPSRRPQSMRAADRGRPRPRPLATCTHRGQRCMWRETERAQWGHSTRVMCPINSDSLPMLRSTEGPLVALAEVAFEFRCSFLASTGGYAMLGGALGSSETVGQDGGLVVHVRVSKGELNLSLVSGVRSRGARFGDSPDRVRLARGPQFKASHPPLNRVGTPRQPPVLPRASPARHSTRFKPRPCELCYRPLIDDELRFCASCERKAKRLGRRAESQ